jgi:hypothetical protein
MDRKRQHELLNKAAARVHEQDQRLAAELTERVMEAPQGWLPPPEERHGINPEILEKCLGITAEQSRALTGEQRLTLVSHWFAGDEKEIPYEEWGLSRPAWLQPGEVVGSVRRVAGLRSQPPGRPRRGGNAPGPSRPSAFARLEPRASQ